MTAHAGQTVEPNLTVVCAVCLVFIIITVRGFVMREAVDTSAIPVSMKLRFICVRNPVAMEIKDRERRVEKG